VADDVFCRIARGEERAFKVYEDGELMVIMDIYPLSRGQVLVIPKKHFVFFYEMPPGLVDHFYRVVNATGRALLRAYTPKAVVMLARGLRIPHYHLMLIPVYEGDFIDRMFSLMDAVQGFPPVPPGEVEARLKALASTTHPRAPRDPESLERDRRILEPLVREELSIYLEPG